MNDYELLGLMDTHKAAKAAGASVPDSFDEFLAGLTPLDDAATVEEQPTTEAT